MIIKRALLGIVLLSVSSWVHAQQLNTQWKEELAKSVEAFKACTKSAENGVNPCSKYIGESLKTVYQVNDFYSEKLNRYLTGTEIISFLQNSSDWKNLGGATQEVLTAAQNSANASKAVVAIYVPEDGIGHVAIILPGSLTPSGSWGMSTPNSASFFMNNRQRSYANKGLSYAFSKSMMPQIAIYQKN